MLADVMDHRLHHDRDAGVASSSKVADSTGWRCCRQGIGVRSTKISDGQTNRAVVSSSKTRRARRGARRRRWASPGSAARRSKLLRMTPSRPRRRRRARGWERTRRTAGARSGRRPGARARGGPSPGCAVARCSPVPAEAPVPLDAVRQVRRVRQRRVRKILLVPVDREVQDQDPQQPEDVLRIPVVDVRRPDVDEADALVHDEADDVVAVDRLPELVLRCGTDPPTFFPVSVSIRRGRAPQPARCLRFSCSSRDLFLFSRLVLSLYYTLDSTNHFMNYDRIRNSIRIYRGVLGVMSKTDVCYSRFIFYFCSCR